MSTLYGVLMSSLRDVMPVAGIVIAFQYLVIRRPFVHVQRLAVGFLFMLFGLALLVLGLERALFPIGRMMVEQLTHPDFVSVAEGQGSHWRHYFWVGAFGAAIAFASVYAEPALAALALKAEEASGGTVDARIMRIVVALGSAVGVALSVVRIVSGTSLYQYIAPIVAVAWLQTFFTPRAIRPLAYDAGVAGISTIMVPLLVAIGMGLAAAVPGRNILVDGFGLIVLAALMPVVTLMGYVQIGMWWTRRRRGKNRP